MMMWHRLSRDQVSGQIAFRRPWEGVGEPGLHSPCFARRLALRRCPGIRTGQRLPCAVASGLRGEGPVASAAVGCLSSPRGFGSCAEVPAANAIGAAFQIDHFGGVSGLFNQAGSFASYPIESLSGRGALFSDRKRFPHVHSTWDPLVLPAGFLSHDTSLKAGPP